MLMSQASWGEPQYRLRQQQQRPRGLRLLGVRAGVLQRQGRVACQQQQQRLPSQGQQLKKRKMLLHRSPGPRPHAWM